MNDNTPIKQRLQIRFGKYNELVYTSNLDVAKMWERVLRRAKLPILYSQGFNTRPRIALASALPLGISSECEILDVSLREPILLTDLVDQLADTSPPGLKIFEISDVPVRSPALQTRVRSSEYRIHFEDGIDRALLEERIARLLSSDTLAKEKEVKGRTMSINVRSLVYDLQVDEQGDILAHLAVGDRGNVRPDEILAELGLADEPVSVHRFQLHLDTTY